MVQRQVRTMKVVLLLSSVGVIVILSFAAYQDNYGGEWRKIQRSYRAMLIRAAHGPRARTVSPPPVVLRQIYLPELRRTDRCTSCHLGIENPSMADAQQPFRLHPGEILARVVSKYSNDA